MTGPAWLADLFALLMLAVAAHCLGRLIAAPLRRRAGDPDADRYVGWNSGWYIGWDIDLVRLAMGIAMAAMFVPRRNPLAGAAWNDAWEVVFALATGWFLLRAALPLARRSGGTGGTGSTGGLARGHHLPHVLHSGAMLFMYLAVSAGAAVGTSGGGGAGMGGMSGMSDGAMSGMSGAGMGGMAGASGAVSGTGSGSTLPTLALLLAVLLTGYAVLVCDRASARPASGAAGPGCASVAGPGGDASGPAPGAATRRPRVPRPVAAAEVVVSVAMAYMLVLML